jgi:hypothetical protein
VFLFFEMGGSHYVPQANLEIMGSSDPPRSGSQAIRAMGVNCHTRLPWVFGCCYIFGISEICMEKLRE